MQGFTSNHQTNKKKQASNIKSACVTLLLFLITLTANAEVKPSLSGLYDTGSVHLYMECYGSGSPTIVINNGLGGTVEAGHWNPVIQSLSNTNQICIYDRANMGRSEATKGHYDLADIVEQQQTLLTRAGVSPPYLMVGHSIGAYPIKLFNHRFGEQVAGILLLDPSLYGQFQSHINKWDAAADKYDQATQEKMQKELARWRGEPDNIEKINYRTSEQWLAKAIDFADKPYTLLWARNAIWQPKGERPEGWHPAVWQRIKASYLRELNLMMRQSKDTLVQFASTKEHYIHVHEPQVVIDAIQSLLTRVEQAKTNN